MADIARLADLPVDSTLLLPCRLTVKTASGATLETLAPVEDNLAQFTITGSFSIAIPGGAVTGAWTTDPRDQPVRVVAIAVVVGDVLQNLDNGVTAVVRMIGLGPQGERWSPALSGQPSYTGVGWQKIDHLTLP